jgi:uncharacterized protein YjbI with pentapeptide repeats
MSKHIRKILGLLPHRKQIQQIPPPHQQPTSRTPEEWSIYWKAQGQPWRTEPEIDKRRQEYLAKRRLIIQNIEQGIYPFKSIKLNRADVEWLLATHENGRGPVDWNDGSQRKRKGLDLRGANLSNVDLEGLPLARMIGGLAIVEWLNATEEQRNMAAVCMQKAHLKWAQMQGADLLGAQMQGADLVETRMQGADLGWAQMQGAYLEGARMQEASLYRAQMQGANLREAQLDGVNFAVATLSDEKYGPVYLADVRWGDVNLAVVDWGQVIRLCDEQVAHQEKGSEGKTKDKQTRLDEYKEAVRANRQLAVALRDQGLNEEADHFAYRAQKLQRIVLRRQGFEPQVSLWQRLQKFSSYVFSLFLDLLAGYGYRPGRSIVAYLVIIFGFMGLYLLNSHIATPYLRWDEALVLSVSSFHGRGFFSQNITLGDTYARLAAAEAVVGLVIEISFIATFTQRFFGK